MAAMQSLPRRQSLGAQTEELLRRRIIEGVYAPGEKLVEIRLSDELGVSRSPLREALQVLQREGLIQGDGRGHLWVTKLSVEEILQLFEVRTALESLAIQHAAARRDHKELADELLEILEPLKSARISFEDQIARDLRFHERLCEASGNPILLAMWRQLASQIRIMILAAGAQEGADRMRFDQHSALVDAVRAGDVAASAQAMLDHMAGFRLRYAGTENQPPAFTTGVALSLSPAPAVAR